MKVLTKDLTGPALVWATGQCEYPGNKSLRYSRDVYGDDVEVFWIVDEKERHVAYFNPTTNRAQCSEIVERDGISVIRCDDSYEKGPDGYRNVPVWFATSGQHGASESTEHQQHDAMYQLYADDGCYGPTPMVAAMRRRVTAKFGIEVDVPDQLVADCDKTNHVTHKP